MNVVPKIDPQLIATVVACTSFYSVFLIYACMFQIQENIIRIGCASFLF